MTDRLKFEHRQPNTDWQDSISNILLPLDMAAQRATTHANTIFDVAVNITLGAPMHEDEETALIYQSEAIRNQMLDLQEMIEVARTSGKSFKKVASGGAS